MNNDDDLLKSLIVGGGIGAALGAFLSKRKGEGVGIGALAGAVLLATFKANENARKTNVPFYIEEDGSVFEINARGQKRFIKRIEPVQGKIHRKYKLK